MSFSASLSSFDLQPQNLIPFIRRDHPFSSTHVHTNKHCLPWPTDLLFSFKPNMNIKSVDLFLSLSCTPHIALTMDLSVRCKIPISLSFKHHANFHTVLLVLCNSYGQLLSALEETFCHTATLLTP